MDVNVSIMSTIVSHDTISETLFGQTRRAVLALLFGRSAEAFYLREIVRLTGAGMGAVQRELRQLVDAGLVDRRPHGKQVYFSANLRSPVFEELRSLLAKTAGLADVLRESLAPLAKQQKVRFAFIYGSVATGTQRAESDIDVMVIGEAALRDVIPALQPAQERLAREINPTIYSETEFKDRLRHGEHFVSRILERSKIMLIGNEDEFGHLAQESLAGRTPDEP
jgi:predicted nucleotidyltransferase